MSEEHIKESKQPTKGLPPIPVKRYFTIGEVSELCDVKPHVLRYWEQEFTQLKPVKRRGNRRYYQHHEVLLIRRIRELLWERGFTINGARNQLDGRDVPLEQEKNVVQGLSVEIIETPDPSVDLAHLRSELESVLALLTPENL